MTAAELPVIAAIPNYNMADSLAVLLPQVLQQGYDAVYVLDDASTDDSRRVVEKFGSAVRFVAADKNLGAGGARNRILDAHSDECIIHFLDADVRLETANVPALARQLMADPAIAITGGLVAEVTGQQSLWNFGPAVSAYSSLTAQIQYWLGGLRSGKTLPRRMLLALTRRALNEWPDVSTLPKRRLTYYVIEGNFFIRRSTFAQLGGFDTTIREHDMFPLARAAYLAGLLTYFDPSVAVTHQAIQVRGYNRHLARRKAMRYLIRQQGGYFSWWFPEGHFKPKHVRPSVK